jgi:beta-N-acetylhexosaminidase
MSLGPLMLDLEGTELSAVERERIVHPAVGGVILFARNVQSLEQVRALLASVRAVRPELILAVDQEGGRVRRVKQGVTALPALGTLGQWWDEAPVQAMQAAKEWGWLMASEMLALGFDISFAPVLDLNVGRSRVVGDRAFHGTSQAVVALGRNYIEGMHDAGMAATGKHFPGHGWVEADSHHAIPVDERPLDDIRANDLQTFRQLARNLDAVMPAHVIYQQVDARPAGFSPFWLQQVLRTELQFDGVIFSDDLTMEGASVAGDYGQRAQAALEAGCDMVLVCNNPAGAQAVIEHLERHPATVNQERLQRMRARRRVDWDKLVASTRYLDTQVAMQTRSLV